MTSKLSRFTGVVLLALGILMVIIGIAELARDDAFVGVMSIITALALAIFGTASLTRRDA